VRRALVVGAFIAAAGALAFLWWRPREGPGRPTGVFFEDAAAELGLTRVLRSGSGERLWILENVGAGCGLVDVNGDGRLDVFLANAGTVDGKRLRPGPGPALHVQRPDGRFDDRTREAGLESQAWQTGVAAGDIDNDGDADLLVTCFGESLLYWNRGDGTFVEGAAAAGITGRRFSTSAVFLDHDRDGWLDLYIASYVRFDLESPPNDGKPCLAGGIETACGPGHCEPESGRLYRNLGGKRFEDVSVALGVFREEGSYGLGVAAADLDGDRWPEIYVANDTTASFLWRNLEGKRFEETGIVAGAALSDTGQGQAGMGVDIADLDGDQVLDIFVTNYAEEPNAFYRGLGGGLFEDWSSASGLGPQSFLSLGWGARLVDFDADGALDVLVANGHVHPQAERIHPAHSFAQRCLYHRNLGAGRFAEEGEAHGEALARRRAHRGLAVGDIDQDGDLDALLTVLDGPPVLLRQVGSGLGQWLFLRLEGTASNRDAVGARVTVEAGGRKQVRQVSRGGSYLSAQDPRLHFGLGAAAQADRIRVEWPAGTTEELGPAPAGRRYRLREGSGRLEVED
jgi:hypothetical protein